LLQFSAIFAEDVERDVEKDVDSSNEKSRQALEGPDRKRAKPIGHVPPRLTSAGLCPTNFQIDGVLTSIWNCLQTQIFPTSSIMKVQGPSNLCGVIMGRSANQL